MKRIFLLLACLCFAVPAVAQDAVELEAPAVAVATADGTIVVTAPDAGPPEPAPADAEPAPEPDKPDAEPAVAVADAAPETIVIPVVDPVDNPSTGNEVVDAAQKVKEAWYTKSFPAIAGAVIFLILTLLRLPLLGGLVKKIPQRVRILVAIGLSFLAAFFQVMALGAAWDVALLNVLGTGSTAVFANELIVESILGKRYKKAETKS